MITIAVLAGLTCLYFAGFWLGNHQDDGYYITKVATMPYTQTGGNFVYPIGRDNPGFNTYIVNTWEIEASVYVKLLHVSPTLYLRLFQTLFVFFLYLNAIKVLADKICEKTGLTVHASLTQMVVIVVIFFDAHYLFLSGTGLFKLRDMFMVNTGMFLGNSIVRMLGLLLLVLAVIEQEKISFELIMRFTMVTIVLMSKSTVALPVIEIAAVAGLMIWLWFDYGKMGKISSAICMALYVMVAVNIPNHSNIQEIIVMDIRNILQSPVIWICGVIFIASFFLLKYKMIYKINTFICMMLVLCIIPQINDIFESFSVFPFVAGRAITTWTYFFVIISAIYGMLFLVKCSVAILWIKKIYVIAVIGITCISICGFKMYGGGVLMEQPRQSGNIKFALSAISHNPYFMPNSTIELGQKLNELSGDLSGQLQVVTDRMVIRDGTLHPLSIWLRIYAKDIVPVSATERYGVKDGSALSEYKQSAFETFESNPTSQTAGDFWKEIKNLDVNCIVVSNEECAPWLEEKGYKLKDTVDGFYYIWYKE